ncbi:hypothetical protein Ciccas_006609 [Cichlidogyrus casuarinus]|uniref:RNA helicase n=1 Tax=Cichlidogyrus casuarinus TaxID=1844966 RepID=A0ABD2Q933_9PLAT
MREDDEEQIPVYKTFEAMGLQQELLRGIFSHGFEKPSLIQRKAIKQIAQGKDVVAQAQSGSGKTATFSIGVLERINPKVKQIQVLILVPTRELADQVHRVISLLANYMTIRCIVSSGGQRKGGIINKELQKGAQVVVGTPGRILDLLKSGLSMDKLVSVVIDEADEMMNKGLKEQLFRIFKRIPSIASRQEKEEEEYSSLQTSNRYQFNHDKVSTSTQVIIVSATLSKACNELVERIASSPVRILVPRDELSLDAIHQCYIDVGEEKWKFEAVGDIFGAICVPQTVLFASSRTKVSWLSSKLMKEGFSVSSAHGEMDQAERDKVMEKFRSGQSRILVSTDVWARGIDIHTIALVVNYDLPENPSCYLHRIGRSGRFGRKGLAISLVAGPEDVQLLKEITAHFHIAISPAPKPLESLMDCLTTPEKADEIKKKRRKRKKKKDCQTEAKKQKIV